jgi:hypothetical protein
VTAYLVIWKRVFSAIPDLGEGGVEEEPEEGRGGKEGQGNNPPPSSTTYEPPPSGTYTRERRLLDT